jgi:hypothetical protein
MKLNIENKNYTLNVKKAVELGVLTPDRVLITDIKAGDVFRWGGVKEDMTLIETCDGKFTWGGCFGNPYKLYRSDKDMSDSNCILWRTHVEMLNYINASDFVKVS